MCTCSPATQYFKTLRRGFCCCGERGRPSSLRLHQRRSYVIYSVYTNAPDGNEDVKRPRPSTHTNKSLPADCVDLKERYATSVAESTNTSWDVPAGVSHRRLPLRRLADVPSAASDVPSAASDVCRGLRQIHVSLRRPSFRAQGRL